MGDNGEIGDLLIGSLCPRKATHSKTITLSSTLAKKTSVTFIMKFCHVPTQGHSSYRLITELHHYSTFHIKKSIVEFESEVSIP